MKKALGRRFLLVPGVPFNPYILHISLPFFFMQAKICSVATWLFPPIFWFFKRYDKCNSHTADSMIQYGSYTCSILVSSLYWYFVNEF